MPGSRPPTTRQLEARLDALEKLLIDERTDRLKELAEHDEDLQDHADQLASHADRLSKLENAVSKPVTGETWETE